MPILFQVLRDLTRAVPFASSYGGDVLRRHRTRPIRRRSAVATAQLRLSWVLAGLCVTMLMSVVPGHARTLSIVAFGDSLTAGYQLPADAAFPAVLEKALRQDGYDVSIGNAGVSGDTTTGGLDRLAWSVPDGTDGVILELGANDMLRGQDPATTRTNLKLMIEALQARHIRVFLAGMLANRTLGTDYVRSFDAIYPELADHYGVPLDPFFLTGVMGQTALQLADGLHPNAKGVAVIVDRMKPGIEAWVKAIGVP